MFLKLYDYKLSADGKSVKRYRVLVPVSEIRIVSELKHGDGEEVDVVMAAGAKTGIILRGQGLFVYTDEWIENLEKYLPSH